MSKRNSNEEKIDEVWLKLIKSYGLARNYEEYQISQAYHKLMGKAITKYTEDLYYKEHRLYVRLTNAVIREELSMGKTKFIEMINKELGEELVLDVVFS
ncbi:DUF721 domain-containing protein [Parvicella tangerina]|uniref:DUF721 domain-containing protein n=1 Tax=Parvicella tangerina TaxID=2829795 RepID=A0A916N869_9FLAO|nr:DUF721 domain-containing protein [Parvicella tangerina]CAG5076432.1 hypothetical protein CRYO30217_00106 [Parvicella tangerina]